MPTPINPPIIDKEDLPYRPCAGICLINASGLVFAGRRIDGGEARGNLWQMPQGGIDKGEASHIAAFREMEEEIGTRKASLLAEVEGWIPYDLPPELLGKVWKGKYRGQKQKWFAFRFDGIDSDISIETEHPEFSTWAWMKAGDLLAETVPFKREVYARVFEEFAAFLK